MRFILIVSVIAFVNGNGLFPVFIRTKQGVHQIEVATEATVDDVFCALPQRHPCMALQFGGDTLNGLDTLADLGITAESTIDLVVQNRFDVLNERGFHHLWQILHSGNTKYQFKLVVDVNSTMDNRTVTKGRITINGETKSFEHRFSSIPDVDRKSAVAHLVNEQWSALDGWPAIDREQNGHGPFFDQALFDSVALYNESL